VKPKQPHGSPRKPSQVLKKRSTYVAGHKTSVSLEDAFWSALKKIAATRKIPLSDLVSTIANERKNGNLSSAIRLFVFDHYRRLAERKRKGKSWRSASTRTARR
jgi:predicted DNA-binding ribbon-helix-helix protein